MEAESQSVKVRTNSRIKFNRGLVYLSEALKGEPVGLMQQYPRYWTVIYGPLSIGLLDDHTGHVLHTTTKLLPMSPVAQCG